MLMAIANRLRQPNAAQRLPPLTVSTCPCAAPCCCYHSYNAGHAWRQHLEQLVAGPSCMPVRALLRQPCLRKLQCLRCESCNMAAAAWVGNNLQQALTRRRNLLVDTYTQDLPTCCKLKTLLYKQRRLVRVMPIHVLPGRHAWSSDRMQLLR